MPWRETAAELERARAEQPVVFPSPSGRLFGIYTPPAPEAPPAGLCAVLLTRPRSHRNRMWVEAARRLAGQGFGAFRFDYHGCGDSEGENPRLDPDQPFRSDVVAAIRMLRRRFGQTSFVVSGACFDARTALSAFLDEGDAIAGLVFVAAPVMALDTLVVADAHRKDWRHLMRALGNPYNWRTLGSRERWRYMARMIGRVAERSMTGGAIKELPLSPSFLEHFRALLRSRARALFLYGREDLEYESFRVAEGALFARLDPQTRSRFEIVVWPGAVHGMFEMVRQRETLEAMVGWMEALHPQAACRRAAESDQVARNPHPATQTA
jgi:pimeloyl-ACP methyl ester carboxylesterase